MYRITFFIIISFLFFSHSFTQEYSQKWGVISQAELNLQVYDKDPEAEALILFDKGDSHFDITPQGLEIRFERVKRIKILSDNGTEYANISIPYYVDGYGKTERVSGIQAIAYNRVDGRLIKSELSHSDVFDEKTSETWHEKKFAIPNVKVGTIIEYKYRLESPFMYNLPKSHFQDRIPTLISTFAVRMVPFYEYSFIGQGLSQADLIEQNSTSIERTYALVKFRDVKYTFEKKNVQAFKDESYITSINDHIIKINFQLAKINYPNGSTKEISTTWPKLVEELRRRDSFGKYIKKCSKFTEKILEEKVNLTDMTQEQKAKRLIDYVKSSFRWDGNNGKSARISAKAFVSLKKGNVGDINLFLVALLRSAGIDATPVISSTRSHGKLNSNYPFEHYFNYTLVLVKIDNKPFLTDGTATMLNYNRIPTRCINHLGLAIDSEEGSWISLETKGHSLNKKIIRTDIYPEEKYAKTALSIQCTDFEAYKYREKFRDDTSEIQHEFEQLGYEEIGLVKTMNYERIQAPYTIQIEGQTEVGMLGEQLVVYPFLGFPPKKNQLSQKERSYPIDFIYAKEEEFLVSIGIPENYKVASLPEDYKMDNELVEIFMECKVKENLIEIEAKYFFKKAVYKPAEYKRVKSYIDIIINRFNQEIVLKKVASE